MKRPLHPLPRIPCANNVDTANPSITATSGNGCWEAVGAGTAGAAGGADDAGGIGGGGGKA